MTHNESRYSIEQFIAETQQRDKGQGLFELESSRMLEINLDGEVWTRMGSMIAYHGKMKFSREGILEHGIGRLVKKLFSGEGARLTRVKGRGRLYVADQGKKISVLNLRDDVIVVNGNDLLAFEPSLDWDIKIMKKASAVLSGGLFNVRLEGTGMIAIGTHYDPLTLRVRPGESVMTDPNATVAWSGTLEPRIRTDVSFKTFVGRSSGESLQMCFDGDGFVVVQPFEEDAFQGNKA